MPTMPGRRPMLRSLPTIMSSARSVTSGTWWSVRRPGRSSPTCCRRRDWPASRLTFSASAAAPRCCRAARRVSSRRPRRSTTLSSPCDAFDRSWSRALELARWMARFELPVACSKSKTVQSTSLPSTGLRPYTTGIAARRRWSSATAHRSTRRSSSYSQTSRRSGSMRSSLLPSGCPDRLATTSLKTRWSSRRTFGRSRRTTPNGSCSQRCTDRRSTTPSSTITRSSSG